MDILVVLVVGFMVFIGIAYAWVAITGKNYHTPADAVRECIFVIFCWVTLPFVLAYTCLTGRSLEWLATGKEHGDNTIDEFYPFSGDKQRYNERHYKMQFVQYDESFTLLNHETKKDVPYNRRKKGYRWEYKGNIYFADCIFGNKSITGFMVARLVDGKPVAEYECSKTTRMSEIYAKLGNDST